jgi:membrane protease YdiL (CAAX protease family)
MSSEISQTTSPTKVTPLQILAWAGALLLSILPDILVRQITGSIPSWIYPAKLSLITLLLLLSLFWEPAKRLQRFFFVFLAIFLTERAWQTVADTPQWRSWFPAADGGFLLQMLGIQLGRLAVAFAMIAALFVLGFGRKGFFLDFGDLNAPASPLPIVGVDKPTNWRSLGLRLGLYAFLTMLVIMGLLFGSSLNLSLLSAMLPALPMILLLAAMNSFSEELTYRAALLAPIHRILGATQAIWLAAVFFGIGHFYGVPSGIVGGLASTFFGWVLGRSMLETKSLFWPWFIHFCADVVIFSFLALAALQVGG